MSKAYNPDEIELKWQKRWEDAHCFEAEASHEKPKFYRTDRVPVSLRSGSARRSSALATPRWTSSARKRRMEGYNVLFPIGYDAFGLPTENYAIKNHVHPASVTEKNIDHFREQLKRLGFSFDWTREINTTDPNYLQVDAVDFPEAVTSTAWPTSTEMPINWCTELQVRPGQRRSRRRHSASAAAREVIRTRQEPVDAKDHRVCAEAARRSGRRRFHRAREGAAAQLDRQKRRRGGRFQPVKLPAKSSAFTPPARIRSSARPTWSLRREHPIIDKLQGHDCQLGRCRRLPRGGGTQERF